jgi:hypothetical protein
MFQGSGTPFDSIESAHEFITLLAQTIYEVKLDIEADIEREQTSNLPRRLDALRMVVYTLEKLELHMNRSRRALNDLRTLRRLLFEERAVTNAKPRRRSETKVFVSDNASPVNSSVAAA